MKRKPVDQLFSDKNSLLMGKHIEQFAPMRAADWLLLVPHLTVS
jgi:hypothetical protein